jgi:hypothetical protein
MAALYCQTLCSEQFLDFIQPGFEIGAGFFLGLQQRFDPGDLRFGIVGGQFLFLLRRRAEPASDSSRLIGE